MKNLLKDLVKKNIISMTDFVFAQFISSTNNIIMLVTACISFETKKGHLFLSVEYFKKNNFFSINNKKIIKKILFILNKNKINWSSEISKHHAFSNGDIVTPLVYFQKKVYIYKIWKSEKNILQCLYQKKICHQLNLIKIRKLLNKLFPSTEYNMQKLAVALSLINQIFFILGGPGTGKTTTIIKIIIALIKNTKKNIQIQLSAPTGKATARLIEILNNDQIFDLYLSPEEKKISLLKPVTIHQLLGISKTSDKIFFNKKNPLHLDVLIIDEASMINIIMMNHIFSSIQKHTKLIFIGDHNQLPPIGAGSILKTIYNYSGYGYSSETTSLLKQMTQYSNVYKKENKNNTCLISDKICILKKNYRFEKNSGISILSKAIYDEKKEIFFKLFNNSIKNIFFYENNNDNQYQTMINKIIVYNKKYWNTIDQKKNIQEIITQFQNHQILCIIRDSHLGVNHINQALEQAMYKKKIIKKYFYINHTIWYLGKPIIITKNNQYLNLCNGDIGIAYFNSQKQIQVCFLKDKHQIKYIPIDLLEHYETAWCITVHKAQGSEFNDVTLILPNKNLEILNQEILYTAITRARKKLNIFSNKKIFITTVKNTVFNISK